MASLIESLLLVSVAVLVARSASDFVIRVGRRRKATNTHNQNKAVRRLARSDYERTRHRKRISDYKCIFANWSNQFNSQVIQRNFKQSKTKPSKESNLKLNRINSTTAVTGVDSIGTSL